MVQNERLLRDITATAASVVTVLGAALLMVAMLAELHRRRTGHSRFVLLADRFLPAAARRTAVAVLTVLSAVTTFIGPQTASADTSVRDWLTGPTPTTQPAPEPTPITIPAVLNDRPDSAAPGPAVTSTPPATAPPATGVPAAPRRGTGRARPRPRCPGSRRRDTASSSAARGEQPGAYHSAAAAGARTSQCDVSGCARRLPLVHRQSSPRWWRNVECHRPRPARHLRSEPLGYRRQPQPDPPGPRALPPVADRDALTESPHPLTHKEVL